MNNIVNGIMGNTLRRYLIVALMASLAVTGGMFAYAYTSQTTTITATGTADFAAISPNTTSPCNYSIFGNYRGAIPAGNLFSINVTSGHNGDVSVNVYLGNADQLGKNYGLWLMRIGLVDVADNTTQDVEMIYKPLTLQNGIVSFVADNLSSSNEYAIRCDGGVYKAHPWAYITRGGWGTINPSITAEVLQAQ